MSVEPFNPRRAKKSKSGCKTCRIRHVKCDESRPACSKCVVTGRKCDYLDSPPLPDSGRASSTGRIRNISAIRSPSPTSLSDHVLAWPAKDDYGSLCFDYFRTVCCKEFQGHYTTQIWDNFFLKAAQSEASIRHAVLALSSVHYSLHACDSISKRSSFQLYASSNFTTAVKELNGRLDQSLYSHKLALYASLLFTLYELLIGDELISLFHLRHGVNIIASLWPEQFSKVNQTLESTALEPRYDSDPELWEITGAFARAATEVTCYGIRYMFTPLVVPQIPSQFSSLCGSQGARHHLELIIYYMYTTVDFRDERPRTLPSQPLEQSLMSQILLVRNMLSRWSSAFANFEALGPQPTTQEQIVSHILHIRSLLTSIKLATHFHEDELIYDDYTADFKEIVVRSENILAEDMSKQRFSVDMAVVYPLYFTAVKCRHHTLRRRALSLLMRAGREGAHDGPRLATTAHWIIDREENDSKEKGREGGIEVSKAARTRATTHHFDQGGDYVRVLCARRDEEGIWTCFAGVSWYDGNSQELSTREKRELEWQLNRYRQWIASVT